MALSYNQISLFPMYADDTQLYISFKPDKSTTEQSISILEACDKYVRGWMLQKRLKL